MDGDLRGLQETLLGIMDDLDKAFVRNGVRYHVGGGCALGCARGGKFVPWDDDIDVEIVEEDFEKAVKALSELDDTKYSFQLPLDGTYCKEYMLVSKKGTTHIVNGKASRIQRASVEILIVHPVPDGKFSLGLYHMLMKVFTLLSIVGDRDMPSFLARTNVGLMRTICKMLDCIGHRGNPQYVEPRIRQFKEEKLHRRLFASPKRRVIEGHEYNFPGDMKAYLTEMYGNYNELPPEDERVPRPYVALSLDTDYCDYVKRKRDLRNFLHRSARLFIY